VSATAEACGRHLEPHADLGVHQLAICPQSGVRFKAITVHRTCSRLQSSKLCINFARHPSVEPDKDQTIVG
jgi:hypothetical protein